MFRLADELHASGTVSEELFAALAVHFAPDQLLELVITSGWYHTFAFVINAAGAQREEWAERFPTAAA